MPTNVDFFSMNSEAEEIKVGTLSWDGERLRFLVDNKARLMKVVEDPEVGPPLINFEDDPQAFLLALNKTYKSYALRASEPYEGEPTP